jgi:hypothetical protein
MNIPIIFWMALCCSVLANVMLVMWCISECKRD